MRSPRFVPVKLYYRTWGTGKPYERIFDLRSITGSFVGYVPEGESETHYGVSERLRAVDQTTGALLIGARALQEHVVACWAEGFRIV